MKKADVQRVPQEFGPDARTPYLALLAVAEAEGRPRTCRTDLTEHDRRALLQLPPGGCFYWLLYEYGTHLMLVTEEARLRPPEFAAQLLKASSGMPGDCLHFWDGAQLLRLGSTQAAADHWGQWSRRECQEEVGDDR